MTGLLDGIPEAVAMRCLAYVPLHLHPNLELVSRSWLAAIRSDELFRVRKEVGSSENLLCVCSFEPENIWQVYSPNCDRWLTLPPLPSRIRHLAHFGAVTTAGKLFVLGGGSVIRSIHMQAEVDVYWTEERSKEELWDQREGLQPWKRGV